MPLTASKMATCISTYTRAAAAPLPLTVGLARIAFSALRFHSVTASCADKGAFSMSKSANSPRTRHGQFWEPPILVSQLVFIKSRSEEHTSELQSRLHLVCRLLLE